MLINDDDDNGDGDDDDDDSDDSNDNILKLPGQKYNISLLNCYCL